jgi:hypothetical protein
MASGESIMSQVANEAISDIDKNQYTGAYFAYAINPLDGGKMISYNSSPALT